MNVIHRPAAAIIAAASVGLGVIALAGGVAQDWMPFRIAAALVAEGRPWTDIYPPRTAEHLFDVPDAYRAVASDDLGEGQLLTFGPDTLTAFVSPPPSAFLLRAFVDAHWRVSLIAQRIAITIPVLAAFWLIAAHMRRAPDQWHWALIVLLGLPATVFLVMLAQPTGWLVLAAAVSILPPSRWHDRVGVLCLALGILTKATPVVVAVGLLLTGRRRLGAWAMLLTAIVIVVAWPLTGIDAWRAFGDVVARLGEVIQSDGNNASVDAELMRWTTGEATLYFRPAGTAVLVLSWVVRLVLVLSALFVASRRSIALADRVSAVWIAWLALTPLLWLHYLAVLVPLLSIGKTRATSAAPILAAALSVPVLLSQNGVSAEVVGHTATIAWLATAGWVLLTRAVTGGPTDPRR